MQWRVIVRMSLSDDQGSVLRNSLSSTFAAAGLQNTATGIWESPSVDIKMAADSMASLIRTLADPSSVSGVDPTVALNHLWIYVDQAK